MIIITEALKESAGLLGAGGTKLQATVQESADGAARTDFCHS